MIAGERTLDVCGCCGVIDEEEPPPARAGLSTLPYRSGTQVTVLRRMLDRLSTALPRLTAHTPDDPAVALLDAWATVADVVTFYQERILNEGFLRTATERRSVLELARAIGYELRPGVASSTDLVFTVESVPGAVPSAVVPERTPVRSVPGQGEQSQTFETDAEFTALAELNEVRLPTRQAQTIGPGTQQLYLAGVTTGLRVGDGVLVVRPGADPAFRILSGVEPLPATSPDRPSITTISWDKELVGGPTVTGDDIELHAFRLRAALFGHNAPDWLVLPDDVRQRYVDRAKDPQKTSPKDYGTWPGFGLDKNTNAVDLDGAYTQVVAKSWCVLTAPGNVLVVDTVKTVEFTDKANFGITGRSTSITLDNTHDVSSVDDLRKVVVYAQPEKLPAAEAPRSDTVEGRTLELDRPVPLGPTVFVTGTPMTGPPFVGRFGATVTGESMTLDAPLPTLNRESVRILGNVASATHGETVQDEVLGSGDGTATHQRFTLRKPPLTYVPASTPTGAVSTLEVRVDEVLWTEVPSLFLAGPQDHVYVVRIDDDARATVIFGDGERGARLPTGQENVHARYRSGIGPSGDVSADSLSLLTQRPLGIVSVTNPSKAGGGVAPETLDEARVNAPLTVLTLDRVVSLRDHEDFARAFTGIAKARAVALQVGGRRIIHLTVVATGGAAVDPATTERLRDAIAALGGDADSLRMASPEPTQFHVGLALLTDPAYQRSAVEQDVTEALRSAFGADRRSFAQAVAVAEVIDTVQHVAGVVAATVTALYRGPTVGVVEVLDAHDTRYAGEPEGIVPAELLVLDPGPLDLGVMTP